MGRGSIKVTARPTPRATTAIAISGVITQMAALVINRIRNLRQTEQRRQRSNGTGSQFLEEAPAADMLAKAFDQLFCGHFTPPVVDISIHRRFSTCDEEASFTSGFHG